MDCKMSEATICARSVVYDEKGQRLTTYICETEDGRFININSDDWPKEKLDECKCYLGGKLTLVEFGGELCALRYDKDTNLIWSNAED